MTDQQLSGDHWVYFGDGNAAQLIDSREYIKYRTGIRWIKFILLPSRRIGQMYDLSEEQDKSGAVVKEYPSTDVIFLERGVYRTRCWVLTDFIGGATPASRHHEDMAKTLQDTERLLKGAEAAKNRLFQELEMERVQKSRSIKLQTDIIRQVAKARGRTDDEGSDLDADIQG